jgi:hypothetical protein
MIFTLCRMLTWVVLLRMFWNLINSLPVKRGGSLSFLMIFTFDVPELLDMISRKIWCLPYVVWYSGTAKVKIVKNERDPRLFTGKLLRKFQNILRNTTQVIIRHRVKILFSVISSPITLERQKWKSSKMKGILVSSPVSSWSPHSLWVRIPPMARSTRYNVMW